MTLGVVTTVTGVTLDGGTRSGWGRRGLLLASPPDHGRSQGGGGGGPAPTACPRGPFATASSEALLPTWGSRRCSAMLESRGLVTTWTWEQSTPTSGVSSPTPAQPRAFTEQVSWQRPGVTAPLGGGTGGGRVSVTWAGMEPRFCPVVWITGSASQTASPAPPRVLRYREEGLCSRSSRGRRGVRKRSKRQKH